MPYSKPDVFVTVTIPAPTPVITTPKLRPAIVGEHYFVKKDAFVDYVLAADNGPWLYPGLPQSVNDISKKLEVDNDAASAYKPTFYLITDAGGTVDVTDKIDIATSKTQFSVKAGEDFPSAGSLFVSYRARDDKYAGTEVQLLEAATFEDLTTLFGGDGLGPSNPLGYGMYNAWQHGGVTVTGVAVTNPTSGGTGSYTGVITDLAQAYSQALDQLKLHDVYMVVPMTDNPYVADVVRSHVNFMSGSQGKSERRMIFVPDMSGRIAVRGGTSFTPYYSILGDTVAERTALNGGKVVDPQAIASTAAGSVAGRIALNTSAAHGITAGEYVKIAGISDLADGTYEVLAVIDTDTFEVAGTWTITDTGTWNYPESAIGTVVTIGAYDILRVAAGNGSAHGTYYIKGYSPNAASEEVAIDGNTYTVAFGAAHWSMLAELESSVVQPAAQRIKVDDEFEVDNAGVPLAGTVDKASLAGNEKLLLVTFTSGAAFDSQGFKVFRTIDPATQRSDFVAAFKALSRAYGDERVTFMAPEYVALSDSLLDIPSHFAAAQLAGVVCRVGTEIPGESPGASAFSGLRDSIENLWKSSRYFTESELDDIGGAGWTILVNSQKGQPITTRHTLTTDFSSIERGELILGVERDFLSRTFREELRKDLRKFRIDRQSLNAVALRCDAIAKQLSLPESTTRVMRSITVLSVIQDPDQLDAIIVEVEATHLYPYNQGKVNVKIVV